MSEKKSGGSRIQLIAIVVWLVVTLSLASWWLIFGLQRINRIALIAQTETVKEIERWHFMLLSEGIVLLALLLGGGIGLLYFLSVEMRRSRQIHGFFAAFTHDLKTSLASLRLQAESLEEDLKDSSQGRVARRLVKDSVRLELQLDNSLFIADTEMGHLHIEDIKVRDVIESLQHYWPELQIQLDGNFTARADQRALESILKNLLQNAVIHGKATRVEVRCEKIDGGQVLQIEVVDNGRGFSGDAKKLGQIFMRHTSTSGSGIGLHLARRLAVRMNGKLEFISGDMTNPQGFRARLLLPGGAS